ncbi:MAG TPA: replicative DNA helicase [Egibacteraceae bacterium]|nr:replicative DNA helicase [Egibacteraceae bacterium]
MPEAGTAGVVRLPAAEGVGYDRVPPHNLDAEVSVLGSMLLSKDAIAEVSEIVGPEDFYRGAHRTMFEAISDLYNGGEPVDPVTLADELEQRGTLDSVGGAVGIADLVSRVPTAANALYYARIVSDQSLRRRLIDAGTKITRLGYTAPEGADEAVDSAESLIYQVAQRGRVSEFTPMKDLLTASFELLEKRHERGSSLTGLATGFIDFDELTAGLQPSNLVILAARPAMGKSTLATNIATHVAVELRKPAVLFSLEMSQAELVERILSAEARVDSGRLRTGRLEETDWPKLSQAMGRLAEAPLFIDDTPGINLMEIRSKCRRLKQTHGLDLVVLDYLQLMQSHRRVENRVQEVSELSRGLKILAKELDVPVLALSQLSRKPEDRTDRRPQLADLRESGSIEQDADLVAFIYRDEVYHEDSDARGEAELILAKHRNGPLKTVRLSFLGHNSRFASMARGGMRAAPTAPPGAGGPPRSDSPL